MTIRNRLEQQEKDTLSPYAALSSRTRGRVHPIDPDDMRTEYQRDRDRILHCKSFRRLKGKTQVFISPQGDHYRTRLTHTLEVTQVARTLARALCLNEDLAEAIAMGHDLGHTPFGHAGEDALTACLGQPFRHNEQSLRVVDVLENDGAGLNLSHEVRLGILGHSGSYIPETLEGRVIRWADRIAYVNHDIDDAVRAGILTNDDIPKSVLDVLGYTHGERIDTLVCDMILTSREAGDIVFTPQVDEALDNLRNFLFEKVYRNPVAKSEESKAKDMIKRLYDHYYTNPQKLPEDFQPQMSFDGLERTVCDYIAGMTDKYSVDKFTEIFTPTGWRIRG